MERLGVGLLLRLRVALGVAGLEGGTGLLVPPFVDRRGVPVVWLLVLRVGLLLRLGVGVGEAALLVPCALLRVERVGVGDLFRVRILEQQEGREEAT